jgi:hypothetical protein
MLGLSRLQVCPEVMRIYMPFCAFCFCGRPFEDCTDCRLWLLMHRPRIEEAWRQWWRMHFGA